MKPRDRFALILCLTVAFQPVSEALARRGIEPFTALGVGEPLARVDTYAVAELDRETLIREADARQKEGHPFIFAEPIPVSLGPATHGTTELLDDGDRLWRLRIEAPGATDLNLGFSRYRLPPGATLYVFSETRDYWEGPYTFRDNAPHGELWLPVVPGPRSIVELYIPASAEFEPELEIGQIGYGFRDKFNLEAPLRQGFCNNDVICPEWDAWNDDEQAAAVYQLNGFWTCSGQMVMNTAADFTPYFLTARHCGISSGNDHTMVVYWNYESPNCGDLCCGNLSDNQTGAIWRASRSGVDFCLVELEEDPDSTSNVYWAGWDRSGVAPVGCIAIHHPSTDEKAISWNDDLLTTMNSCIGGGSQTHWRVNNWEDGTTEPGSSGSGIWDPVGHYLIGFLSGGLASCTNINYDCYGKFSLAWDGTSATSRLSDWLDPGNTGAMTIAGSYSGVTGRVSYVANGGTDECASNPSNENGIWEPGEIVTIPVTLLATGNHTSITGTLSTSTAGVVILDDTATWPDLGDGQTAESDAPHFQIAIDPGFPCGETIDFDLSLSSAEGGPWAESFSGEVGGELTPIGLPIAIPDNLPAGVESPLQVDVDETILDVEVYVKITHTRVGDLVLKLQSPTGTTVTLLDRPMYPLLPNGCEDNDMKVTFTDAFPANLDFHCAGSAPWYSGDAKPMTPLSAIDLESSLGTWKLIVEDHGAGDTGSIDEWRLLTTPVLRECEVCPASTGADLVGASASAFGLSQNRPNPFQDRTTIRFELVRSATTSIEIFDVTGRSVRTLVDRALPAGPHTIVWDGRDSQRKPVAGGIYFYRLTSGGQTEIKRMSLVR
jgi:subtilisin-like proprotein convertase family protein